MSEPVIPKPSPCLCPPQCGEFCTGRCVSAPRFCPDRCDYWEYRANAAEAKIAEQAATWKWIETSEMLPPPGRRVAIIIEDEEVYILGLVAAGYYHSESSGWWHGTPGDYRSCRDQRWTVTHWAFLPPILPKSTPTGDTL
jgi:hypothetical protein